MQNYYAVSRDLIISILSIYLLISPLCAQNLVPNPDFDDYSRCPSIRGEIKLAAPWYSPNGRTTDFAHACAGTSETGIPANNWGFEFPVRGDGYAGLRTWGNFNGNAPYREYLATELLEPLKAGEAYRISFMISLGDSARYVTDDIALHVSRDSIPSLDLLPFAPHISNPQGEIIYQSFGWKRIYGQYMAVGGEKHIVIGNFLDDDQTTLVSGNLAEGLGANSTYFFIDHVIVEPCSQEFPDHLILAEDSLICPGESLELFAETLPGAIYTWENGSQDTLRNISQVGMYSLRTEIDGCFRTDSIEIGSAPVPIFDLGADTSLCPGETILLSVQDSLARFRWNDRFSSLERIIDTAGMYILELALGSCLFVDSIEIAYEDVYVQAPPKDTLLCESAPAILLASYDNAAYMWSDFSNKRSLETREIGEYWVDIDTRCFRAREYFRVETENCGCESFIPNVFTPNGDGIHDRFRLEFTEGISNYSLEIFDRYGRSFFRSLQADESWDGKKNNKSAVEGVYFWVAQYTCYNQGKFRQEVKKGYLSLLR